jgi:alcohol dehydrogenase (NADP+)
MHWPVALKKGAGGTAPEDFAPLNIKGTWAAMEKCYEKGLAKAIGISNFSVEKTKALLSHSKVRPAVNQVECHPLWQQKKLWPYLKSEGIHLTVSTDIRSRKLFFTSRPLGLYVPPIFISIHVSSGASLVALLKS